MGSGGDGDNSDTAGTRKNCDGDKQQPSRKPLQPSPPPGVTTHHQCENGDKHYKNNKANDKNIDRPPCPLYYEHKYPWEFISQTILFGWAFPLLRLGMERPIEELDLPELYPTDTSDYNRSKLEELWNNDINNTTTTNKSNKKHHPYRLGIILFQDYVRSTWLAQVLLAINMTSRIVQALALGFLMEQLTTTTTTIDDENNNTYLWVGIMVGCGLIAFPTKQRLYFETYRKGMQLRVALVAALYNKSLRLPSISIMTTAKNNDDSNANTASKYNNKKNKTTTTSTTTSTTTATSGHVTNLASNDVERFLFTSVACQYIFLGPLEALAILLLGIYTIGPVFATGYVLLGLFVLPLQFHLGRRFAKVRSNVAALTDARVTLLSQAISGARVVKMNGWELEIERNITSNIRTKEVTQLQRASRYKAVNETIYYVASVVVAVCIFTVHVVVLDGTLTARNVFTTMSLLNILQFTITKHIPNAVMGLSECAIASRRIQAFLELEEQKQQQQHEGDEEQHPQQNVEVEERADDEKGTWKNGGTDKEKEDDGNNNNNVNKDSQKECYALEISGMTCYWNMIIDPPPPPSVDETVMAESPSSNIALYNISLKLQNAALHCIIGKVGSGKSALLQALAGELPFQRGRISRLDNKTKIAYATQDPWIMDGTVRENIMMGLPFDQNWYNEIISACGLTRDIERMRRGDETVVGDRGIQCSGGQKARIGLARAFYCNADILLLDDPLSAVDTKVARSIFYSAIQGLGVNRGKCVILVTHQHQFVGNCSSCTLLDRGQVVCSGSFADCVAASGGDISDALQTGEEETTEEDDDGEEEATKNKTVDKQESTTTTDDAEKDTNNIQDAAQLEKRRTGIVQFSTWLSYGKAIGGVFACLAFFLSFALTQTCLVIASIEIGKWAEVPAAEQDSPGQIGLILGLTGTVIVLAAIRAQLSFALFLGASRRLHAQMVHAVLRAKIEFFDTSPLGRILNRFSADVGISDETLPLTIYDFSVGCFVALASVAASIAVLPMVLVVIPPLILVFLKLRKIFVMTTRELKRLEGMARSPIFALLSESLNGIATIRSNNKMRYVKDKFEAAHDAHTRAFFAFVASSRWFATQMELLAFTLMAVFGFSAVLFHQQGWFGEIDPAVLGVALTMLLQMTGTNFPWIVRQSAEVTNQIVSVERILEYGNLPQEAALELESDFDDNSDWPKETSIVVNNVATRYRANLPLALKGISFKIGAGQRVGVVGRTGSGKSSLVQALFRILEPEEGSVVIGDVDTSTLGLHKLRTNMSVIPQTPILFSGSSIRENVDPFGRYKDADIRAALQAVHMLETVKNLPMGLDAAVAEGGSNLSVGQRQLLCLSRAILLRNDILILDEPTANVDMNTDRLLQETLKEQFSHATVISVAHRLDTIIDYDLILVFGDGKVQEFGPPHELLQAKGELSGEGSFASMVRNTGPAMSKMLTERAMAAAAKSFS